MQFMLMFSRICLTILTGCVVVVSVALWRSTASMEDDVSMSLKAYYAGILLVCGVAVSGIWMR